MATSAAVMMMMVPPVGNTRDRFMCSVALQLSPPFSNPHRCLRTPPPRSPPPDDRATPYGITAPGDLGLILARPIAVDRGNICSGHEVSLTSS